MEEGFGFSGDSGWLLGGAEGVVVGVDEREGYEEGYECQWGDDKLAFVSLSLLYHKSR